LLITCLRIFTTSKPAHQMFLSAIQPNKSMYQELQW
jgi:hypothetical protein